MADLTPFRCIENFGKLTLTSPPITHQNPQRVWPNTELGISAQFPFTPLYVREFNPPVNVTAEGPKNGCNTQQIPSRMIPQAIALNPSLLQLPCVAQKYYCTGPRSPWYEWLDLCKLP